MRSESVVLDPSGERSGVQVLRALRRNLVIILSLGLVCGGVAAVVSAFLPVSYTSSSTVYLSAAAPFDATGTASAVEPTRFTTDQAGLMTTSEVLSDAGRRVTPPLSLADVSGAVTTETSTTGSSVIVSAVQPTATRAEQLADAVVAAYRARTAKRVSEAAFQSSESTDDQYLRGQIAMRAAAYGDGVSDVEPAGLPLSPSSPLTLQNTVLATLIGLIGGCALAILREQRSARRATIGDLELLLGAPFVGRVQRPEGPNLVPDPAFDHGPEHDVLAAIDTMLDSGRTRSVLFLSWQRGLTQTSLVASTAVAAARSGVRVFLVDGGGKPRGLTHLSVLGPCGRGVEGISDPERAITADSHTWEIHDVSVDLVPWPETGLGATGLPVRPQALGAATNRLRGTASLILVDGPLLTERSLGLALGRGVDGVMLVVDQDTSIDDAHEIARRVALSGARLIGFVVAGNRPVSPARPATWSRSRRDGEGPVTLQAASTTSRHS